MAGKAHVIDVDNETQAIASRVTADGRKLSYRLHVLQQPQRARACGAGAKSSADRRPVDPPPIVELKILEGEADRELDVTFHMQANYFLFATLEPARPIAQGRVPEDKSKHTVMAGSPVAGMVYLDRPKPAGYFIFPDLSVRHEGKYRLSFSLFEELKQAKDADQVGDASVSSRMDEAHVTNRLEVKSEPFDVFSAKKFPGLTESTVLSRTVAEQGCRVRIRRDVRMRRRETKDGREWAEYEDETATARARQSASPEIPQALSTPAPYAEPIPRSRSASTTSFSSILPPLSRRASASELTPVYNPTYAASHLTRQSGYDQTPPYGVSPTQQHFPQPPSVQQQSAMQPPPPQFYQHTFQTPPVNAGMAQYDQYYGTAPAPPPATIPYSSYTAASAPPYSAVSAAYEPSSHLGRTSFEYPSQSNIDHRRSNAQYPGHALPPSQQDLAPHLGHPYQTAAEAPQYSYLQNPPLQQPLQPRQSAPQTAFGNADPYIPRPPPLQPVQPPARASGASTPLSPRSSFDLNMLPPLHIPDTNGTRLDLPSPSASSAPSVQQGSYYYSDSHKRSYGDVFSDRYLGRPLRDGARPRGSSEGVGVVAAAAEGSESGLADVRPMYRRADGRPVNIHLPPPHV